MPFATFIRADGWELRKLLHDPPIMYRLEDRVYKRYVIHTGSEYAPGPDKVEYREVVDAHK